MEWYALSVAPKHEKSVHAILQNKNLESFLPTYWVRKRWSDRRKEIELPLFPGYVFCRFHYLECRTEVLRTQGVRAVVGCGRPEPVEEVEIAHIQKTVASGLPVLPWSYVRVGERVRISSGAMEGVEGIVLREKGNNVLRVVISVHLLQRSVAVEIDRNLLLPVKAPSKPVQPVKMKMALACQRSYA